MKNYECAKYYYSHVYIFCIPGIILWYQVYAMSTLRSSARVSHWYHDFIVSGIMVMEENCIIWPATITIWPTHPVWALHKPNFPWDMYQHIVYCLHSLFTFCSTLFWMEVQLAGSAYYICWSWRRYNDIEIKYAKCGDKYLLNNAEYLLHKNS